ncbi:MAG: hypothetical protein JWP89_2865 [Schlesneria sp.]|nr:hypothetical protein [Schlesneria sp.]
MDWLSQKIVFVLMHAAALIGTRVNTSIVPTLSLFLFHDIARTHAGIVPTGDAWPESLGFHVLTTTSTEQTCLPFSSLTLRRPSSILNLPQSSSPSYFTGHGLYCRETPPQSTCLRKPLR